MKIIKKYWFVVIFAISIVFPIYGKWIEKNINLNGVESPIGKVTLSIDSVGNGTYQEYINDTWENKFPGKKVLVKLRNQFLYSCFSISPNTNVVIGKNKYLFEPEYIMFEEQIYKPSSEEYFNNLGKNLKKLQNLLDDNGKELYVFITPSKAHFFKDYIPSKYSFLSLNETYSCTNYSRLIEQMKRNGIPYFDSIEFINDHLGSSLFESPLFYESGIHWSHPWGEMCAAQFLDYINNSSKYSFGTLSVKEVASDLPVYPSTDLYSSLNLIMPPDEKWFTTESIMSFPEEYSEADKPNVFLRGGSFMGQSLNKLVSSGAFNKDVHFENNYFFTDRYAKTNTLSSFDAYSEMDLDRLLGQSDILILEVNEAAISKMSWGFIEYLLDNPQVLDRDYVDVENSFLRMNYEVTFLNSCETDYNPWGITAGVISYDDVENCILLYPLTSFEMEGSFKSDSIKLQAQIHPWVSTDSDGAGVDVVVLNSNSEEIFSKSYYLEAESSWQDIEINLKNTTDAVVRVSCNSGKNGNDISDWVVFKMPEAE